MKFLFPITEADDKDQFGALIANLASLANLNIPTTPTIVVNHRLFWYFLKSNSLDTKIKDLFKTVDAQNPIHLVSASNLIIDALKRASFEPSIIQELVDLLGKKSKETALFASLVTADSSIFFK